MKKLLTFSLAMLLLQSITKAQITKAEYDKMWAAATASYNATTGGADQKKANTLITQMETKYPKDASVMFTRGVYQFNFLDDQNKALIAFSKAISIKPGYVQAYIYRAKVLAKKGVYEKAIEDLNIALQKEPNNINALGERADNNFLIKNYENAVKDYRTVISLQPDNAVAYSDVANTLKLLGKNEEAQNTFTEALITRLADSTSLHALYGKYLLGEAKYPEAAAEYKLAFSGDKKRLYADDYNSAGVVAYKRKFYENALYYFKTAQKLDPENISYYDNAASVNYDNKNYDNIIREAMAMLRLNPDDAKANKWMSIGLDKSNRNSYYAIYNIRSGDLDSKGSTTLRIADSILYYVPKDAAAYARYINTEAYKKTFAKYLPDYTSLPGQDWVTSFSNTFSKDGELSTEDIDGQNVKRTYSDNKLKIENFGTGTVAENRNTYGIYKIGRDVCYTAQYTVLSSDAKAVTGLNILNDNGVMYYFLINPVTKKYYVSYRQNGKYTLYHGLGDEGNDDIPNVGEVMKWKIIMQNLELAFIINDKIIASYPLGKFTEINTARSVGVHVEGKTAVEISGLSALSSSYEKSNRERADLNWHEFNKSSNSGNASTNNSGPSRRLLGTMLIYADYDTKFKVAEVFEIWGDEMNEQAVFGLMAKTLNSYYTYSKYSWKPRQSAREVTKGWDLRDYNSHGTYFTNGQPVR